MLCMRDLALFLTMYSFWFGAGCSSSRPGIGEATRSGHSESYCPYNFHTWHSNNQKLSPPHRDWRIEPYLFFFTQQLESFDYANAHPDLYIAVYVRRQGKHTHTHKNMQSYIYTRSYTPAYIHIHIHTYTYTRIYTHTAILWMIHMHIDIKVKHIQTCTFPHRSPKAVINIYNHIHIPYTCPYIYIHAHLQIYIHICKYAKVRTYLGVMLNGEHEWVVYPQWLREKICHIVIKRP